MLILQQDSIETRNKSTSINRFQHRLPSGSKDLDDLVGCGVECAGNISDVEEDLEGALNPSAEFAIFLKFQIQPNTTDTLN